MGLGETEIEDREVSVSRDGQRRSTSESKQVRKRRLVLPSEIQNLVANTGFLKLAGEFPVALIEVKPPELPNIHPTFEEQ